MQLSRLVEASQQAAATRSRLRKRAALSECLRDAGPRFTGIAVDYLTGNLPQGRIGLGPAIVSGLRTAGQTAEPRLALEEVDAAFEEVARSGAESSTMQASLSSAPSTTSRQTLSRKRSQRESPIFDL